MLTSFLLTVLTMCELYSDAAKRVIVKNWAGLSVII